MREIQANIILRRYWWENNIKAELTAKKKNGISPIKEKKIIIHAMGTSHTSIHWVKVWVILYESNTDKMRGMK